MAPQLSCHSPRRETRQGYRWPHPGDSGQSSGAPMACVAIRGGGHRNSGTGPSLPGAMEQKSEPPSRAGQAFSQPAGAASGALGPRLPGEMSPSRPRRPHHPRQAPRAASASAGPPRAPGGPVRSPPPWGHARKALGPRVRTATPSAGWPGTRRPGLIQATPAPQKLRGPASRRHWRGPCSMPPCMVHGPRTYMHGGAPGSRPPEEPTEPPRPSAGSGGSGQPPLGCRRGVGDST